MNLQVERLANLYVYSTSDEDDIETRRVSYDYVIIDMLDGDGRYAKSEVLTDEELKDIIKCGIQVQGAILKDDEIQVTPNIRKRVAKYKLIGKNDYRYRVSDCEVKLDSYLGNKVNIKVPDVATVIAPSCFSGVKHQIESLEVPDSVVGIYNTFYAYPNLKRVVLGNGILSLKSRNFAGCYNLKEIILPRYLEEIGMYCFNGCKALKDIKLPSTLKVMEHTCFSGCESLDNIEIPSGVKNLEFSTFKGCKSLKSIKLNEGLESIESNCFVDCESLEYIKLPQSLKRIVSEAFGGCKSLKELDIPKSVTDFSVLAFGKGCRSLKRIVVHTEYMCNHLIMFNMKNIVLEDC